VKDPIWTMPDSVTLDSDTTDTLLDAACDMTKSWRRCW
jgi:hypothetical protein